MLLLVALLIGVTITLTIVTIWYIYSPEGSRGQRKQIYQRINTPLSANQAKSISQSNLRLSDIKIIEQIFKHVAFTKTFGLELRRTGWPYSVPVFMAAVAALFFATFVFFSLYLPASLAFIFAILLSFIPYLVVRKLNKRYFQKFEEYLPDALSIISNAIKVGHGLNAAINVAAENAPYPVSLEFRIVATEISLGLPLQEALNNLYKRSRSEDAKILKAAISINQELGGNLSELLENLEKTIRNRFSLRREIKAITSQQVASASFLFVLPFLLIGFFFITKSAMFIDFIVSPVGKIVLLVAGLLQLIAFFIIRKILKVEG